MRVSESVPLAPLTTLQLGGPARRLLEVDSADDLVQAVRDVDRSGEPLLLIGGGSNLVLPDEGFPGTVVLIRTRGVERMGNALVVAAGEPWDALVARSVTEQLAGMECLSGIPGLTGATPVQNVGAYGQEVAQTVTAVRAYDRHADEVVELTGSDCGFSYRSSRFKAEFDRYVILEVRFELRPGTDSEPIRYGELARALQVEAGDRAPLTEVRSTVLRLRKSKGMVLDPQDQDSVSAGSFFTNPMLTREQFEDLQTRTGAQVASYPEPDGRVKVAAAWLISQAGFDKGYGDGPARISTKHSLALTNRGGATTADLLRLAREVRDGVREKTGIELVNEPVVVGQRL
ncbi:MAG TPA: UDP-N-acetylmuramate dehydrogenase [Frankiaceae bacterium]|nr:UDP-N-acetylmuramate dehydrogenase [Frankiaceae bacterium]